MLSFAEKLKQVGGVEWEKAEYHRIYFEELPADLEGSILWYDVKREKFLFYLNYDAVKHTVGCKLMNKVIEKIRESLKTKEKITMKETQTERLLGWLKTNGTIDPLQAWQELGIYRLGARIFDLKRHGCVIINKTKRIANRYGEACRVAEYELIR
jgi:hypothetical protein